MNRLRRLLISFKTTLMAVTLWFWYLFFFTLFFFRPFILFFSTFALCPFLFFRSHFFKGRSLSVLRLTFPPFCLFLFISFFTSHSPFISPLISAFIFPFIFPFIFAYSYKCSLCFPSPLPFLLSSSYFSYLPFIWDAHTLLFSSPFLPNFHPSPPLPPIASFILTLLYFYFIYI